MDYHSSYFRKEFQSYLRIIQIEAYHRSKKIFIKLPGLFALSVESIFLIKVCYDGDHWQRSINKQLSIQFITGVSRKTTFNAIQLEKFLAKKEKDNTSINRVNN